MIATIASIAEKKKIQRSHRSYGNRALMDWNVVYVVQTEVFNGFTLKTVLSVLFNQMKNDPRNVVSEELNLKWQNQIESELRVLMPWRSAWRFEDICVEETDYGKIYIFWGTPFFVPLSKIYHVNRFDYRFIYTLMVTLIFFNRRIRLNDNHKIIRSKYLLLSDWLNLLGYFLIPPSITGKF